MLNILKDYFLYLQEFFFIDTNSERELKGLKLHVESN